MTQKAHPLAGRSGAGPPIAPPGWTWRAGHRIRDMYFYSPNRVKFRSQVQLNAYLESKPGSPSPKEFRWSFSPTDYQDGSPKPGNPPSTSPILRKGRLTKDDGASTRKHSDTPGDEESTPRLRAFSRLDEDVERIKRDAVIYEAHRGKRLFETPEKSQGDHHHLPPKRARVTAPPPETTPAPEPDDALTTLLKEGAPLGEKSPAEMSDLKALVEAKSPDELQRSSVEVLRVYYRILRNEEPPASFGITELSKLCTSWACKHRRPWCLQERSYIFLLRTNLEADMAAHRTELENFFLSGASCKQAICCIDPGFCLGCNCNLCKGPIQGNNSWTFIGCDHCHHLAHLECAITERKAGVVPERDLDIELICSTCSQKTDLVHHWKARIKEGLAAGDRGTMDPQLSSAARLAEGTKRVHFQPLLAKVKALRSSNPNLEHPEVVQDLRQVVDSIEEYDDRAMDDSVVEEMIGAGERLRFDVSEEEARAGELQKKAELEFSEWLSAEKVAEGRRVLVKQMEEEVGKAAGEAERRREAAAASRAEYQKAEKRLRLVRMLKKMKGISGKVVELQRWNCEQERAQVELLQKRFDRSTMESKWEVLYKALLAQEQRYKAAQSKLKQLSSLQNLLLSDE